MAGIVHFSNFFRMMEAAEHAFFRSLGSTVHGSEIDAPMGWPRVSASCDFRMPLRFEDEVEIHLVVAEVRNRSIRYEFTFRKVGEEAEVAHGSITAVCARADKGTGRLAAYSIPDTIRAQITAAPPELLRSARSRDSFP